MDRMPQLVHKLSQRDGASIFNCPVSALEYPDYHNIVKKPMDLGTIQAKLAAGEYSSPNECATDVRLVWTNAFLYNQVNNCFHRAYTSLAGHTLPSLPFLTSTPKYRKGHRRLFAADVSLVALYLPLITSREPQEDSCVAESAHALSKVFEGMYNKINPDDFNYHREPTSEERQKFSRDIYRVIDEQLGEAVTMLERNCPQAVVRDNSAGEMIVKVDELPPPVFWEVELFLRKNLALEPERIKKKIPTTHRHASNPHRRGGGGGLQREHGHGGGQGRGQGVETGLVVGVGKASGDNSAATQVIGAWGGGNGRLGGAGNLGKVAKESGGEDEMVLAG